MSSFRSANASSGSIILSKEKKVLRYSDQEYMNRKHYTGEETLKEFKEQRTLTQNSAKCLDVLEFSARNVGPNVYT